MALTIIKNPSNYNFSKSPVICEIQSDNYIESGNFGLKAKALLFVGVNPPVGTELEFNTVAYSTTFTWVDYVTNPTPSPGQVRTRNTGSQTPVDYWIQMRNDILLDTTLAASWTLTDDLDNPETGGNTFTAINGGADYSMNDCAVNSSNLTQIAFYNLIEGTDDIRDGIKPNYFILVDLYMQRVKNSLIFDKITTVKKEPFFNSKVRFDLSKIIDANLDYYFPTPNQNTPTLCENTCKEFYVTINEVFGVPPVITDPLVLLPTTELQVGTNSTYKKHILKAGFSPANTRIQPDNQLVDYIWSYPLLLTTTNDRITIKKNEPQYIYFCCDNDYTDLKLKYIQRFKDSNIEEITYGPTLTGTSTKGSVLCFPVSHTSSDIYAAFNSNTENIKEFEVCIVQSSDLLTAISPSKFYVLDYEPLNDNRVFLFTNSMSGVDTIRSTGDYENDTTFEGDVSTRKYYSDDAKHLGFNVSDNILKQETFKVFSGWLTKDKLLSFEELFLAKYKVEVIDITNYYPIIITTKSYKKHKTNQFLYGVEFEYYHQFKSPVTDVLKAGL